MSEENSLTRSLERISRMINSQSYETALNNMANSSARMHEMINSQSYKTALNSVANSSARIQGMINSQSYETVLNSVANSSARMYEMINSQSYKTALNSVANSSARMYEMINSQSYETALNSVANSSARMYEMIKASLDEGLMREIMDFSTYIELDLDKFEAYEEKLLEEENNSNNYKSLLYPKLSTSESLNKLHVINNKIDELIDSLNAAERKIDSNKEYTNKEKGNIKQIFKNIITLFISNLFIGVLFGFFGVEASSLEDYIVETGKQFAYNAINYLNESSTNKQLKSSKMLVVYKSNRKDSERIGSILEGQQVEVIYKKRNWSKIVYIDDYSKEYKEGWVFTRYLVE